MNEKDIKCGYSTIVKINKEVEELRARVDKLEGCDKEVVLEDMTVVQLKGHAYAKGIDLGATTLKAEIIKVIEVAQAD